jgi:phasin family protein
MYFVPLNPFALRERAAVVEADFDCTTELFDGFERVVEFNAQAVKTSISEQQAMADAVLSTRSLDEFIDLHSQHFPAAVKKTFAYCQHLEDIVVETGSRLFSAMYSHSEDFLQDKAERQRIEA